MNKRMLLALGVVASLATVSGVAQAQTNYHWPAAARDQSVNGQHMYLPPGTPLMLKTRTQVNTKDVKVGDRIYLEVAEAVSVRGQVVIPIGAPVLGEVSMRQKNGHFGRKGKVAIRFIQAETPSGPVRLTGTASDEGTSGTLLSVGTMAFVSIIGGALIHGTSGDIAANTGVTAYLADPLHFYWRPAAYDPYAAQQVLPDSATRQPATMGYENRAPYQTPGG